MRFRTSLLTIFNLCAVAASLQLGVAFGDMLYVASGTDKVLRFTADGTGSVFAQTGLNYPTGLAFDGARNLYVSNLAGNTIEKFTPDGVGSVFASSGLNGPAGLAFDGAGNLFVANINDSTITEFTPGGVETLFASSGLFLPSGLAFDAAGNLYVANQIGSTIEKFTPAGVGSLFAASGLSNPNGLAFDSSGNLFAASTNSGTIEEFTPSGAGTLFASGLNSPAFLTTQVPEPSSLILAVIAAICLGWVADRTRDRSPQRRRTRNRVDSAVSGLSFVPTN